MKLASLKKQKDGELVVVSRDLAHCVSASGISSTLRDALDDWDRVAPLLSRIYDSLNENGGETADAKVFDQTACASPLPRASQWLDGSAYVNHVELVRKARNAEMPESFWHEPLMYQGGSDSFIGPYEDIPIGSEDWGIDFEGEIAVITNDVPMGQGREKCEQHIKLLMLVNDVSLRSLIPQELGKGFGFLQSKPSSVFSPVVVTPEEVGTNWRDGKLHLPLNVTYNNELFGMANAGEDMTFDFHQLIAHAAKTRPLGAGTIIGSGTVSNKQNTDHGSSIDQGGVGYSCIAEVRMIEQINGGQAKTPFMKFGDRIRIEMLDSNGDSIFGAIDQTVVAYQNPP